MIGDRETQAETVSRYAAEIREGMRKEQPHALVVAAYVVLLVALLAISVFAGVYERFPGDLWITRRVQDIEAPGLEGAMRVATDITSPTNSIFALVVVVVGLVAIRRPRLALFAIAALSAHAMGAILKFFVDRGRPDPALIDTVRYEEDYSYPSGHVEWVVAFEGFVVFAIWQLTTNTIVRALALVAWVTHIVLTSGGRVDQGLHWPSDVVASYMVGALALLLVIWLFRVSLHVVAQGDDGAR
jgi:undecaprenyl-diphosphatase